MLYKIHHRLVDIHIPQLILPATFIGNHVHQLKYAIPVATIDSYKFSFYQGSIRLCNQLPSTAVFAVSPVAFQAIALPAIIGMKSPTGSRMQELISTVLMHHYFVSSCCVVVIFLHQRMCPLTCTKILV